MILAYILSFSLLVMSVIKVTDLFFQSSKNLESIQKDFIKETKQTHDKGSITLTAALFTVILSLLLIFFSIKFKIEMKEARYRKDSYLCFRYLNITTNNYIFDMTRFNWGLRTAYLASLSLIGTAEAMAAFKSLKLARDVVHYNYLKNLMKNSFCKDKIPPFTFLKNLPYETYMALQLKINFDGTTKVREKKWSLLYLKSPQGIRLSRAFFLTADMELNGNFLPNLKIKTRERAIMGFSKLNYLSGSQ